MNPYNKCAWATLVMLGDTYVPGALVLAASLRLVKTKHRIICMVTTGVSNNAITALKCVFDDVIHVSTIHADTKPLPGQKQQRRYGKSFLNRIFTKWSRLKFDMYDLVCFVDADIAFKKNPDELFTLKAPAGSFLNPWQPDDVCYMWPKHRDTIPKEQIRAAMKNERGFVVFGSLVLLEPNIELYNRMMAIIDRPGQYGDGCNRLHEPTFEFKTTSGPDELMICDLFSACDWTHIGPQFQTIAWKDYGPKLGVLDPTEIIGYHYHGEDKPWDMDPTTWPDLKVWFDIATGVYDMACQLKWIEVMEIFRNILK